MWCECEKIAISQFIRILKVVMGKGWEFEPSKMLLNCENFHGVFPCLHDLVFHEPKL